jgi:tetratricopeptide (TPR) repeat protein
MQFVRAGAVVLLCLFATAGRSARVIAQDQPVIAPDRDRLHQSDEWAEIQRHLPDPATAAAQALELQADILRARRFPQDALDYYRYALARGGNAASLLNKLGLTELEMHNVEFARAYFQRSVKLDRKSAAAWNNLGAVNYLDRMSAQAVSNYKRAIKLDKRQAVFHANLATVSFEIKDYSKARHEIAAALELDPQVFEQQGTGGVAAHVLSSQDRAQFYFEMAKMYAREGLEEQMLHSLATAAEAGMDVQTEMAKDPVMARFVLDPRVLVLVHNAELLRAGRAATVSASGMGTSPPSQPVVKPAAE